jgi:hypothetical protein
LAKNDNLGLATDTPVQRQVRRMETITCTVRNNGDLRNEVILHRVTPPELVVLRRIHGGAEAVVNCTVDGACQYTPTGEKQRLTTKYPRYGQLIEQMFGGIAPDFMTTLAEVEELAAVELGRQVENIEAAPSSLEPQPLE